MVHFSASGPAGIFESKFISNVLGEPFDRLRDPLYSGGLKEGYDDNGGKHKADDRGIDDGDDFDGLTVFIIVEAQSLEDGRKAMAHVEPDDDEKDEIGDGNMGNLKLCSRLLIEIEIAVNPAEFDEEEIGEMQQQTCQEQNACPHLQLGARMALGTLWFVVAFGSRHLIGNGQPDG